MPTEKRQRQKEGRRVRLEAQRKALRRRQLVRRSAIVVVVAGAVVGSVFAFTGSSTPPKKHQTTSAAQAAANQVAEKAGCPASLPSVADPANDLRWSHPPKLTLKARTEYFATMKTTQGTITIRLNAAGAPVNVNNFVFLARAGFYRCVTFQRVIPQFMMQGGDPTASGQGGPGYVVPTNEFPKPVTKGPQYPLGTVAMANSCGTVSSPSQCKPTNGSQFFIVGGPEGESLPAQYTVIGKVTSGLGVVEKIVSQGNPNQAANGSPPVVTNRILSVTITTVPEK